ncbi:MAG TPA: RNase adapter RapZ [Candidatus Dormibacteraeota bacterium]
MALVIVGAARADLRDTALRAFEAEGWARALELHPWTDADAVLEAAGAGVLSEADARGIRYVLVHHGPDDGVPDGTYARAHHRVEAAQLPDLARRLRSRERLLVTCLAFAFKNGIPEGSAWVVDTRFLANPYWVPELRPLDGRDARVRDHVLGQPPARALLEGLEATVVPLLAAYFERGRTELTIAFGCTGGHHRSVVLAVEMAERLRAVEGIEVACRFRELQV